MSVEAQDTIKDVLKTYKYLAPFICLGAAGGVIKAINVKDFSAKDLTVRAITGAFGAALAGLYLKNTCYPIEVQFAIAGAIGTTATELIKAVQVWIMRRLTGDEHYEYNEQEVSDPDNVRGNDIDDLPDDADTGETGHKGKNSCNRD